jgi:FkbM family methyltransferase
MNSIKPLIKKITPKPVWNFLRHYKAITEDFIKYHGSYICTLDYFGYKVFYTRGMIAVRRVKHGEIFEPRVTQPIVKELLKHPEPIFLDIGSNIGLVSLYVLSEVPNVKILAFEPGAHQRILFQKTIDENKLSDRITLYPYAMSNKNGTAQFSTHFNQDATGDGFFDTGRAGEARNVEVQTRTLDSLWPELNISRIDAMKIDTEGSELMILKGAQKLIQEFKPIIYLEIHRTNLLPYHYTHIDILNWFHSIGYNVFSSLGEECTEKNIEASLKTTDAFCARPL